MTLRSLALAAAICGSTIPALAQQAALPTMTVGGDALINAVPDVAQMRAGVTTQAKTAREASEANAKAMTAVIAALKAAGIEEKDIRTTRLAIQPQHDANRASGRIVGFQASNQVTLRLNDVGKVAEVIDAMVSAGANDLGGIDFLVSDQSKLLDAGRAEAIQDARRKAELYAKAAGVNLGRVIAINEDGGNEPVMMRAAPPTAAMATPIMPGERTLRLGVTVTYQIIP